MTTRMVKLRRRRAPNVRVAALLLIAALLFYLYATLSGGEAKPASAELVTERFVLSDAACYAVQFATCDSAETARVEAARYVPRGAAGYVRADGAYRVLGAGYETRAEAETVAARLSEAEGIACEVYEVTAGGRALSATGAREQLDALNAARDELEAAPGTLSALAYALDRGETNADEARARLATLAERAEAAGAALPRDANGEDVATRLAARLSALARSSGALAENRALTELQLSGGVKYACLEAMLDRVDFLASIPERT